MSYPSNLDVSRGLARGMSSFYRFGENNVGTSHGVLSSNGVQYMPAPSGASQLSATSTSANDTLNGTGGTILYLEGLDANGDQVSETISMAGTGSTDLSQHTYWRLHTATIVASGTYGDPLDSPSYDGAITVSGGGNDWAYIADGGLSPATWNSGFYTVPKGHVAYVTDFAIGTDSNKFADLKTMIRQRANDEVSPSSWIEANNLTGFSGLFLRTLSAPFGPLDEFTDLGVWGRVSQSTARVDIGYAVTLVRGDK